MIHLLVFNLDHQHYALPVSIVERVVRAVEITYLPKAPEIVLGVINVQDHVIPVVNVRRRFQLPERELSLSDSFIIAQTPNRFVALVADAVTGVIERTKKEVIKAANILPGVEYIEGVAKVDGDLILIHDLNRFLSLPEETALNTALNEA